MRWLGVAAALLVLGGAAAWWLTRPVDLPSADAMVATADVPVFQRASADSSFIDAGVTEVRGVLVEEESERPVAGARVRVLASAPEVEELTCPVCHAHVLECMDSATAQEVMRAARDGELKPPAVLFEVVTDVAGAFAVPSAPVGAVLVADQDGAISHLRWIVDAEPVTLILRRPEPRTLHLTRFDESPAPGARATLFEPLSGAVRTVVADAKGEVVFASADPDAWVFAEADGALPVGNLLVEGFEFDLEPPRTLVIRTVSGGQPVDADVTLELHRQTRTFPTVNGVLRLAVPFASYELKAARDPLLAFDQTVTPSDLVTEVVFELRKAAKLVVSVTTEDGEPLPSVSGTVHCEEIGTAIEAKDGALLIFDAVPEAECDLSVYAPEFVELRRRVDLGPGETRLDVTLERLTIVKGTVLSPTGTPVEDAHIDASQNGESVGGATTDEAGEFTLELPYAGTYAVEATLDSVGRATMDVVVPGPAPVLRLSARAALEVRVFDADGAPRDPSIRVTSVDTGKVWWADGDALDGPARLAGLPTGKYEVSGEQAIGPGWKREVDLTEGRTQRLDVRLETGATVTGRVIDARGNPVADIAVLTDTETSEGAQTEADGTFTLTGLSAAKFEVWASNDEQVSPHVSVTPPASGVTLTVAPVLKVRGRAVDERGAPVRRFLANGVLFVSDEGRFEVAVPDGDLSVAADGYESESMRDVKRDVGDVVLKKEVYIEGEVVDAQGRPASGVAVRTSFGAERVTTDVAGRFKIPMERDFVVDVIARRGGASGQVSATPGTPVRITLRGGVHVVGQVLGRDGRGVRTSVSAERMEWTGGETFETDANGRFERELPSGTWLFIARASRVQRVVDLQGNRAEVVLGDERGGCGMTVSATLPINTLWLVPSEPTDLSPFSWAAYPTGGVQLSVVEPARELRVPDVPCGAFVLVAGVGETWVKVPVSLRSTDERVPLPDPPVEAPPASADDAP